MVRQLQENNTGHSAKSEWLILGAGDIAIYSTMVLGYFFSIADASRLLPLAFFALTAIRILYALVAWWMLRKVKIPAWQSLLGMGNLVALTFINGLLAATGLAFDWLLYFATVGACIYLLSTRTALITVVLLYVLSLINNSFLERWHGIGSYWLTLLAGFAFVVAFSYANRLFIVERERSRRLMHQLEASNHELEEAHQQLQQYTSEVEELTVNRERTRMAREIHDTLGHYLTILSIQLETISKLQERDPARAAVEVAEAQRVAAQSMQEVRNAVAALRPSSIATLSLTEALTQLGEEFERVANDTALTLDLDTVLPPLSPDLQLALYRAAQEALTNVRKHAHASKVLLRLRYEDETLELVVLDNGIGIAQADSQQAGNGFGLIGLRERVELLGGMVHYEPAQPTGYRVTIRIPLPLVRTVNTSELVATQGE